MTRAVGRVWLGLALTVAVTSSPLIARSGIHIAQTQRDTPVRPAAPAKPIAGTAFLAGVVTSDDTQSTFIRRVLVTLSGGGGGPIQAVTDDAGRFAFPDLPAGSYTITAEKPGYVKTFFGSRRPGLGPGMPIALAGAQRLTTLSVKLLRGAVISGTVIDENGQPLASAQVTVLQPLVVNGERRLVAPPGAPTWAPWATTDERGRYRFYGLTPGEYTVRSSGGGMSGEVRMTAAADVDFATRPVQLPARANATAGAEQPQVRRSGAYYPASTDASGAVFFTLGAGEERTGIDIRVGLARVVRVEGMAVGPGGQPLSNILVGIADASARSLWASPGLIRPGPDGRFVMSGMLPGRYVFYGRGGEAPGQNAPQPLWTETEVVVNEQDVSGVVLQFLPGSTIAGRLSYLGGAPVGGVTPRISLTPVPTIAGAALAPTPVMPQADGAFAFTGVAPGKYRVAVSGAGAWSLRSAMLNGRDTLDVLLEVQPGQAIADLAVTLTDRPTEVVGTLFDQLGRPAPAYAIVLFSADRSHWTIAPRRTSGVVKLASDGTYRAVGLPPGEYYLAALADVEPAQLTDPAFLDLLVPAAIKITLSEGERKTQDVKLGGT